MMNDNYSGEVESEPHPLLKEGAEKMRRLLLVVLLLLSGCVGWTGPRTRDLSLQKVDPRGLPVPLQEQKVKASLPYLSAPRGEGPRNWADLPEEQYGQRSN